MGSTFSSAILRSGWTTGTVRTDRIEDVDRGVERRLSGAGDPDDWETVAETNDELVDDVAADHEGRPRRYRSGAGRLRE